MCIPFSTEKLLIMCFIHDNNYFNKKSELFNKCKYINNIFTKEGQEIKLIADLLSLIYEGTAVRKFVLVRHCLL